MKKRLLVGTVIGVVFGVVGAWRLNAQEPVKVELKNAQPAPASPVA
jgi:hypothetical protein